MNLILLPMYSSVSLFIILIMSYVHNPCVFKSMCLAIAGVANQLETKSRISYCVTAKSHIIHMGAHEEHNPIFSSPTHISA